MRTSTLAVLAAAALATSQVSVAQRPADQPSARAPAAAAVSDADLETFASIYVDLLGTAAKFEEEMKVAQTEQQVSEVRSRVQTESIAKVAQRGWTPEKFNSVSEAINADPALTEKAVRLIEQK